LRWLVNRVCSEGDTVFDPFAGSATTGVACLQTGRKFIGCEIDERYAEIGRKRLAECQCEGSLFAPRESPGLF
jgi:DNA modification methylase